jgi:hypothetical protein
MSASGGNPFISEYVLSPELLPGQDLMLKSNVVAASHAMASCRHEVGEPFAAATGAMAAKTGISWPFCAV